MKAVLGGKRYDIEIQPLGICDDPTASVRKMKIPVNGNTKKDLDVSIHEMLHAEFWIVDECVIEKAATEMANLLWRLGWRKKEKVSEKEECQVG